MAKPKTETGFALLMTDNRGSVLRQMDITREERDRLIRDLGEAHAHFSPDLAVERVPDENEYTMYAEESTPLLAVEDHKRGIRLASAPSNVASIRPERF